MPLRNEAGEIVCWVGTNTDITQQREAQEALREADRRKDEFISTLAHELRNPLAPVQNAAEILSRLQHGDPRVERMAAVIKRQITQMSRLLDDLLDVARIARGKLHLRLEHCDLAEIVASTAEDYRQSLVAAGITLTVDVGGKSVPVVGDPVRLAQMTGNYLQNASRFAANAQVRVEVRAEPQMGDAVVRVIDTGAGISKELLPKLFSSFAQEEQGLARTTGGLGLGLALTKGLAQLHGGSVAAYSSGLGQGATFEFRIPLRASDQVPSGEPVTKSTAAGTHPLKVLVIEDNVDAAETLQVLLESEGHDVRIASDGRSGVDTARGWRPDLVICDLGLPGEVDGFGVASALKGEPVTRSAKLIALSGYADMSSRETARSRGFDAHLAKPISFEDLKVCVTNVMGAQP